MYGNRIAVKRGRGAARRREFHMGKDAEPADNEVEMEKRRMQAERVWAKYMDSDPDKEDSPDEYFDEGPKVAGVRRSRGNRKEQKKRKKMRTQEGKI